MNKLLFTISNYKAKGMRGMEGVGELRKGRGELRKGGGELKKEVRGVREEWNYLADSK